MEKFNLTVAIFGRGRGVEHSDRICFQRLDYALSKKLAKMFAHLILIPILYRKTSPLYHLFSQFYKDDSVIDNAVIIPVYDHTSYTGRITFLRKSIAWSHWVKALYKAIRKSDLALIYMPSVMGLFGVFISSFLRKPYVLYFGSDWSNPNPKTGDIKHGNKAGSIEMRIKNVLQKIFFLISPVLLIRDKALANKISKKRKGVYYIPGNSEITRSHLYLRTNSCQQTEIICLTVCALVPRKGVLDIIQSIGMLKKKGFNVKLWHAGGFYTENLEKARALCIDLAIEKDVTFFGYINNVQELLQLYRKADLFILASHSEGYPRVIVEAMSQSLPVIATDISSVRGRLTNKHDCLFVTPGDPKALSSAIGEIVDNSELRKRIIRNGYAFAGKELEGDSTVDVIVRSLKTHFPKLTSNSSPGG